MDADIRRFVSFVAERACRSIDQANTDASAAK
jgi:hypothetical protein